MRLNVSGSRGRSLRRSAFAAVLIGLGLAEATTGAGCGGKGTTTGTAVPPVQDQEQYGKVMNDWMKDHPPVEKSAGPPPPPPPR